jgi:hypothetical protein
MEYRYEDYFKDFFDYADLGMPLAFLLNANVVKRNTETDKFITDTWEVFLGLTGHEEDTGFETLEDLLEGLDMESE